MLYAVAAQAVGARGKLKWRVCDDHRRMWAGRFTFYELTLHFKSFTFYQLIVKKVAGEGYRFTF
jgi:hypothetical protein